MGICMFYAILHFSGFNPDKELEEARKERYDNMRYRHNDDNI